MVVMCHRELKDSILQTGYVCCSEYKKTPLQTGFKVTHRIRKVHCRLWLQSVTKNENIYTADYEYNVPSILQSMITVCGG